MNESASLFYRQYGQDDKPALVLLHSGGMTGIEWEPQIESLSKDFFLIVPDQPGHGKSPMIEEKASIGGNGRAVLSLLDALGIEQCSLVGSSMGGATALWLTVHYPQRVDKLVLFRASYRKNETTFEGTREMANPEYWERLGLARWMSEQHAPQGGPNAWHDVIKRVMQAHDPAVTDHNHALHTLAAIEQHVLIVAGDRDPVVPLRQVLDLYETLPNAGLYLLPYTTHVTATNTWRSNAFTLEISRFLRNRGVVKF